MKLLLNSKTWDQMPTGTVIITEKEILVRFQKQAHNPLLIAADFDKINVPISWLGRKKLQLIFG